MTYLNAGFIEARRDALRPIVIRWTWSGGTLDLHPHYLAFQVARSADLHEATPANAGHFEGLAGPARCAARLVCHADAGLEAALGVGTVGTLMYGREGDSTGKPKRGFTAVVRRFAETLNQDGAALFEVRFEATGAPLYGPEAVW